MSNNLFDNESAYFLILQNEDRQYSIWPQALAVPQGWDVKIEAMPRHKCMEWLQENWLDLRPASLLDAEQMVDVPHGEAS